MTNFHDNKLWQASYVALMDIHNVFSDIEVETEMDSEVIERVIEAGGMVTSTIADGLSRMDHRMGRTLVYDAVGLIAIVRTQLAIAWGRGILPDDTFKKLDDAYAKLSESVQSFK